MTSLAALKAHSDAVPAELFAAYRAAEVSRQTELKACITIQSVARGFLLRLHLKQLTHTVVTIQRFWRGYLGRQRFLLHNDNYERRLRKEYFNRNATVIQRHWRGFFSRKYVHSFYSRKRYLQDVLQRNGETRRLLEEEHQAALTLQRQQEEEAARTRFDQSMRKMHHLVSTSHIPGIFGSPFDTSVPPSKDGVALDDHLRASMRSQVTQIKQKQRLPPLSPPSQPGTSRGNLQPGYSALSLRQSIHYNTVKDAGVLEGMIERSQVLQQHGVPFMPVVKHAHPFLGQQSLRNCEQYTDPWDPTVGNRNERFDAKAQSLSNSMFKKYLRKQDAFQDTLTKPVAR